MDRKTNKSRPAGARNKTRSQNDPGTGPTQNGYIKSFDGTRIFYSSEGQGPPLVFCYGLVCSSLHWTYQIEHFRKSHRCIWIDYRGHHNSDPPKKLKTMTMENFAKDLHLVLEHLEVSKPVLLGHSMGVNVVLEYYSQHRDNVSAMVLANGTASRPLETMFGTNKSKILFDALGSLHRFSPRVMNHLWSAWGRSPLARLLVSFGGGFNPYLTPKEDIELYLERVADLKLDVFLQLLNDYETFDATPWLHTVKAPTLIIAGEEDQVVPLNEQKLMNQLIPKSQLEIIHHGSHCPQMDLPDLINEKITKFLKSNVGGAFG